MTFKSEVQSLKKKKKKKHTLSLSLFVILYFIFVLLVFVAYLPEAETPGRLFEFEFDLKDN